MPFAEKTAGRLNKHGKVTKMALEHTLNTQ